MAEDNQWKDPLYIGWLKSAKALEYLQEGIEGVVNDEVSKHHNDLLHRAGVTQNNTCNLCTLNNVLPFHAQSGKKCIEKFAKNCFCTKGRKNRRLCPNGICSKMYDYIVQDHCFKSPLWDNTDPMRWCTDSWSVAKVYQSTPGTNNSAINTDVSGLLSILCNNSAISCRLGTPINPTQDSSNNPYIKARNARNDIMHSPKMRIGQASLNAYIEMFIDVLKDIKDLLLKDIKAKKVYDSLQELKTRHVEISQDDERRLLELKIEALKDIISDVKDSTLTEIMAAKTELAESCADGEQVEQNLKAVIEEANRSIQEVQKLLQNPRDTKTKTEDKIAIPLSASDYEKLKKDLREDLIFLNRKQHGTIPVSPLFEKVNVPLLDVYVNSSMKYVDTHGSFSSAFYSEKEFKVQTMRDIFYTKGSRDMVAEIYLIGDAGLGKTAFCKLLAITWCQAHDPKDNDNVFVDSDIKTLKEYDYLFVVSLRNITGDNVQIDRMISDQIFSFLAREYPAHFMRKVLAEEKYLVILDGLDEWVHTAAEEKSIPDRVPRPRRTILTTTRTWKYSTIQLGVNDIDKKIIMSGLGEKSAKQLAAKVFSMVNQDQSQEFQQMFWQHIKTKNLEDLGDIPLIQMFLTCLWIEDKSLGDTRTQIYSRLFNVFISRAYIRNKDANFMLVEDGDDDKHCTPEDALTLYRGNDNCHKYRQHLEALSNLAAATLLDEKKHSLVFDESTTLKYLSKRCIEFSLAVGVLTKVEVSMKLLSNRPQKYSFLHKTIHEFLAALKVCVTGTLPQVFNTLQKILDVSNTIVFLCGLSENIIEEVSKKMKAAVSNDPIITMYREEAYSSNFRRHHRLLLQKYQDMLISCLLEDHGLKGNIIQMEDFILEKKYSEPPYLAPLKALLDMNRNMIRSLTIDNTDPMVEVESLFGLTLVHSLERLDYWGIEENEAFSSIMTASEKTLKCLTFHSIDDRRVGEYTCLSAISVTSITNMHTLGSLSLWFVSLSHSQINELLAFISSHTNMTYIGLEDVKCACHTCLGFSLNLSGHEQLKILNIGHIPLKDLKISTTSLAECRIIEFPFKGVFNSILRRLPEAKKLDTFVCHFLSDISETNDAIKALSQLPHLKMIRFYGMDMRSISECILPHCLKKLELFQLINVSLSSSALEKVVDVMANSKEVAEVQLSNCSFKDEHIFEQIKEKIIKSEKFNVVSNTPQDFIFRTVPEIKC